MAKIKALMVAGSMHVGGIENQLMHLLRNADREKFQIDFTSDMPDAFYREEIEKLGGRFIEIPRMNWKKPIPYCRAMYRIMKDGQYDVVHSHELFHSGITLFLAKLAGVPCRIAHAHNWCDDDGTGKRRSGIRHAYNAIMRTSINCCTTKRLACSTWAGRFLYGENVLQAPNYHLVYNSVDTIKFLERYDQVETGEFCDCSQWKNVLNVARVSTVKNQTFLVDIAEELRNRGEKIRILCAGSGEAALMDSLRQKISEKDLGEYICLLGVRKDIDVLMRKSSAFVLPSKYEGMPLVMIEAQASGLPCVSADTYSREVDFEIDGVTWLSLDDGVSVWTDALIAAVNRPRASKDKVEAAVQAKNFDAKRFAQILCELYENDCKEQMHD